MGQEGDALDLLVIGQLLLQGIDTFLQHLLHLLVGTKILTTAKGDMVLTCPFLYKAELWNNECRHKLALVGDDCHLVDKLVNKQQCLYLLWSDILTIGCLEQVLDTLGEEQLAVLHISGIASTEEAFLVEHLGIGGVAMIITLRNGRTLEQYLVVLAYLDLDAGDRATNRTDGKLLVEMHTRYRSKTLGQAIAYDHANSDREDKLLHLRAHIGTCRREDIRMLQS